MAKKPIKLAIAGLGRSGWDIHVADVRGDDRYRIVAVMDPLAARRTEAAAEFACETYDDYGEMRRAADADLITLATPPAWPGPPRRVAREPGAASVPPLPHLPFIRPIVAVSPWLAAMASLPSRSAAPKSPSLSSSSRRSYHCRA